MAIHAMHKPKLYPHIQELYSQGISERKIAAQLHTTRRQVITALRNIKSPEAKAQHNILNLFAKGKREQQIKKQLKLPQKQVRQVIKQAPIKVKEKHDLLQRGFYGRMQDSVKQFKEKNFPYYIYGLYDYKKAKDAEYPLQRNQYYHKGIKSLEDFIDFYKVKPILKSYRIYNSNGDRISLEKLGSNWNLNIRKFAKQMQEDIEDSY